jgi:hypothetical protein
MRGAGAGPDGVYGALAGPDGVYGALARGPTDFTVCWRAARRILTVGDGDFESRRIRPDLRG